MPMSAERRRDYLRDYYRRVTRPARQSLLQDRDGECAYCGASGPLFPDHVVPSSRGGEDDPSNIRPACRNCNMSKGGRSLDEWRAVIARKAAGIPNFQPAQRAWLREHVGVDPYVVDSSVIRFRFEGGDWGGVRYPTRAAGTQLPFVGKSEVGGRWS